MALLHISVRLNFKPSDGSAQPTKTSNEFQNHYFFTSQPIPLFYSPTRKNPNALGNAHALFKKTKTQKDKYSKNPQAAAKPSAPVRCVTPVSESSLCMMAALSHHDKITVTNARGCEPHPNRIAPNPVMSIHENHTSISIPAPPTMPNRRWPNKAFFSMPPRRHPGWPTQSVMKPQCLYVAAIR